jgi:acetoin utilization deacetylase AcuC-like enzyme
MPVALITHSACLEHETPPGHPETAARLRTVLQALETPEFAELVRVSAPRATRWQLTRTHAPAYVDAILATRPQAGETVFIDPDTIMNAGSAEAALRAAGGAIAAVDLVMTCRVKSAFVAVRPPGHHAEADRAGGYCLFNNAALAASRARVRWQLSRVAVADFDAHHGNGTQSIFAHDSNFFYASSHQYPGFPGTGHHWQRGVADNIVNAPLIPNSTGVDFRAAWREVLLPALDSFAPELLIISAGFDAHRADPLAYLQLEADDFARITRELIRIAEKHSSGRIVSILEGGYDHGALVSSVAAHVRTLMSSC